MKAAVAAAAALKGGSGGESEAVVVREALAEYLVKRGFLQETIVALRAAENADPFGAKHRPE
jgi:hypothetical protein